MEVGGFEHHNVTQPARLELIGGGIEDTAISEPVPAVLRLERRRHLGTASIVGAAVLETNLSSQCQDGLSVDCCTGLSYGFRPPSS